MSRRLTTEEFVEKAKAIHGDRYDYSKVEYVDSGTKVTIVCANHGPFSQTPNKHVSARQGCRKCYLDSKFLTTDEFVEKANARFGSRYDYSRVDYKDQDAKVVIICPDHGPFEQTPHQHMRGEEGCGICAGNKLLTTEEFIEKAMLIHGSRYDYSSVDYTGNKAYVEIICPDHGAFPQIPNSHLRGRGCGKCKGKNATTESFIEKAKAVHGDRYDYSEAEYIDSTTSVTIICPDHGPFPQAPSNHVNAKQGCDVCAGNRKLTTEEFIERARAIHGNRYDYSAVEYVNTMTDVTIICPDHGPFQQAPNNHLSQQQGCRDCTDWGFSPAEPAILYYLAVSTDDGYTRYKIGITNRTVEDRFRGPDLSRIRVVGTWHYTTGRLAIAREADILRQFHGEKYDGPPLLASGNTELFAHDVLGLDS